MLQTNFSHRTDCLDQRFSETPAGHDRSSTTNPNIGSSVVGTTLPSGAAHLFWPEWIMKLTWHVYFLAGFICSIVGWMLVWPFILALDKRREGIAKAATKAALARVGIQDYSEPESKSGTKVP